MKSAASARQQPSGAFGRHFIYVESDGWSILSERLRWLTGGAADVDLETVDLDDL